MSIDKNVPCYGCERRNAHCHSSCEDYKKFKQMRDEENAVIRKHKEEDRDFTSVRIASLLRNTKDVTVNRQRAKKG
jgi:hypothetical protein